MSIHSVSKSYFSGFQEIGRKGNTAKENIVAALKIFSYLTVILPLGFGIAYGVSSLKGRASKQTPQNNTANSTTKTATNTLKVKNANTNAPPISPPISPPKNPAKPSRGHTNKIDTPKNPKTADQLFQDAQNLEQAHDLRGAVELYKQAAAQGSVKAYYSLGSIYNTGDQGVEADKNQAIAFYQQGIAADPNKQSEDAVFAYAQLAELYKQQNDPKNEIKYLSLVVEAKNEWVGGAHHSKRLGYLLTSNDPEVRNLDLAIKYYGVAAAAGDNDAKALQAYYSGFKAYDEKNYAEALKYFVNAGNLGVLDAFSEIGKIYHYGLGVPENPELSIQNLLKHPNTTDPVACYLLGYSYWFGTGVPEDKVKGIAYYEKAGSISTSGQSMKEVGDAYYQGINGKSVDKIKAFAFYEESAKHQNADALYMAGKMCEEGDGAPKDQSRAIEFLNRAKAIGHQEATQLLAKYGIL